MNDKDTIERNPSLIPMWLPVLIGNLIPLYGALFLNWDIFTIFFLYWVENVVIGVYTALKMFGIGLSVFLTNGVFIKISALISTTFFIGFFSVHYGMFTMGHFSILGSIFYEGPLDPPFFGVVETYDFIRQIMNRPLFWGIMAIVISEGIKAIRDVQKPSTLENKRAGKHYPADLPAETVAFLKEKAGNIKPKDLDRISRLPEVMTAPYGRIIVLHIALLFGGFLTEALSAPIWGLGLLIILKITYDLGVLNPIKKKTS